MRHGLRILHHWPRKGFRRWALPALSACLAVLPCQVDAAPRRFGTYSLSPQGSARVMAMGGAFTGLSDDANGILYNPAGLIWSENAISFVGDRNSVLNLEEDVGGLWSGLPYSYFSYGLAARLGTSAMGFGVSTPYQVDIEIESERSGFTELRALSFEILQLNLPYAWQITPFLSAGITLHAYSVSQSYRMTSGDPSSGRVVVQTQLQRLGAPTVGLSLAVTEILRLGVSHTPRKVFKIDESLNEDTGHTRWFGDAVIPSKTSFGGSLRLGRLLLVADLDRYGKIAGAHALGSGLLEGDRDVLLRENPAFILHAGAEWHAAGHRWWDVWLRSGLYQEPSRTQGGSARGHLTLGAAFRAGFLLFEGGMDVAAGHLNSSFGMGLSLEML